MCPLDFDLIIKITCFTDSEVTTPLMYLDRDLKQLTSIPVKSAEPAPGFTLITEFESIKFSDSDASASADHKHKSIIKYDAISRANTYQKIQEDTKKLITTHHHLLLETISHHLFWLPSHPDSTFSFSQEGNKTTGTFTIDNITGPLPIIIP